MMKDGQTFGQWLKWDFEKNGALSIKDQDCRFIYRELSNGFWAKCEYDSQGNQIYYGSSNGTIIDKRPPEVIEHEGHKYQLIR